MPRSKVVSRCRACGYLNCRCVKARFPKLTTTQEENDRLDALMAAVDADKKKAAAQDLAEEMGVELKLEARVRLHTDKRLGLVKLLAFAELTIAGAFVIKNIRILRHSGEGQHPFVVFPAEQSEDGLRWDDIAHPATAAAREAATMCILYAYAHIKAQEAA